MYCVPKIRSKSISKNVYQESFIRCSSRTIVIRYRILYVLRIGGGRPEERRNGSRRLRTVKRVREFNDSRRHEQCINTRVLCKHALRFQFPISFLKTHFVRIARVWPPAAEGKTKRRKKKKPPTKRYYRPPPPRAFSGKRKINKLVWRNRNDNIYFWTYRLKLFFIYFINFTPPNSQNNRSAVLGVRWTSDIRIFFFWACCGIYAVFDFETKHYFFSKRNGVDRNFVFT